MMCAMDRPLAALLSWIWPTLPAASTTRNHLYPELQALWDQGTISRLLHFISEMFVTNLPVLLIRSLVQSTAA